MFVLLNAVYEHLTFPITTNEMAGSLTALLEETALSIARCSERPGCKENASKGLLFLEEAKLYGYDTYITN